MRNVIKWDTELASKFINENSECELLSEYKNAKEKLLIKCSCGKVFYRSMNEFKNNVNKKILNICPECQIERIASICRHSDEKLEKYFENYKNCDFLFKNNDTGYIYFLCNCGKIFKKTILQAKATKLNRCSDCAKIEKANSKRSFTYDSIKEMLTELGIDFSKIYMSNNLKKLKIDTTCSLCGKNFTGTYNNVVRYKRKLCQECIISERAKKVNLKFEKIIEKAKQYDLEVITSENEYINRQTKILLKCKKHPEELIETTWWAIRDYCPCKKCTCGNSSYEKLALNILETNNVFFNPHEIDNDCKYIRTLQFDFVIYLDENKTDRFAIIETNGQQHYSPIQFGGIAKDEAQELFEVQKIKDQIKRDFCKSNNIPLLELRYDETDKYEELILTFLEQNKYKRK